MLNKEKTKFSKKIDKDLKENYHNYNAKHFADKYSLSISSIYKRVCKLKVTCNKMWKKQKNKIIKDYTNGKSINYLSNKYGHDKSNIRNFLKRNGIKIRPGWLYAIKYKYDKSFFKEIDSHKKAYWLGFIYGDGNIYKNKLQVCLNKKDKKHIYKLRSALKSTHKIYPDRNACRLTINSKEISTDLQKLGVVHRKSLILTPPLFLKIKFISSFIRGYFDADGHITVRRKKFYWNAGFTGTFEICSWIKSYLDKVGIGNGRISKEKRTNKNVWYLNYTKRFKKQKPCLNLLFSFLYNYCYSDYLIRKYIIFSNFYK